MCDCHDYDLNAPEIMGKLDRESLPRAPAPPRRHPPKWRHFRGFEEVPMCVAKVPFDTQLILIFLAHFGSHKDNSYRSLFLKYFFTGSCIKLAQFDISKRYSEFVG